MDELVYRFLLDSGYPRAAIVGDLELLPIAAGGTDIAALADTARPDYAIIDPVSLDRLAVLLCVPALDKEGLEVAAGSLGRFAQRFGGRTVQGFLVRIDPVATEVQARVQFYRVWPQSTLERVSAHAFPDLDTLRTRLLLSRQADSPVSGPARPEREDGPFDLDGGDADTTAEDRLIDIAGRPGIGVWLPGLLLVGLAIADRIMSETTSALLDIEHAVLAVGAAALLVWAMVVRRR